MPPLHELSDLGWSDARTESFSDHAQRGLSPARVVAEHRGQVDLLTPEGTVRSLVRPTLLGDVDAPGVGDWVAARISDDPHMPSMVEAVLPRTTAFVRKHAGRSSAPQLIAANIDTVLIVTSLNADLNARRIERYLVAARSGGAEAVVVLNKADLVDDADAIRALVPHEHVVAVSALEGDGLEGLAPWVGPGRTVALVGMSGVGKSTLVNALLGRNAQDTGGIREHDDRGKHTTTSRSLLPLPGGGCLIDTPGMRELGLTGGDDVLDEVYDDIAGLAAACRFHDCGHDQEPGCAIVAAIEAGDLEPGRLTSYHKLQRELAGEVRRRSRQADREHGRRWGKMIRDAQRLRRDRTGKD